VPRIHRVQQVEGLPAAPSASTQQDLQLLTLKRETLIYEIALDQEAHARLMRLSGQPPSAETGS
jgi:hypothetical protein